MTQPSCPKINPHSESTCSLVRRKSFHIFLKTRIAFKQRTRVVWPGRLWGEEGAGGIPSPGRLAVSEVGVSLRNGERMQARRKPRRRMGVGRGNKKSRKTRCGGWLCSHTALSSEVLPFALRLSVDSQTALPPSIFSDPPVAPCH